MYKKLGGMIEESLPFYDLKLVLRNTVTHHPKSVAKLTLVRDKQD